MKICAHCKIEKSFEFFNKATMNKDGLQYYCRECQRSCYKKTRILSPPRITKTHIMPERHIYWLAGIFEGEGWFSSHKDGANIVRGSLAVKMTDEDTIKRLKALTGIGSIHGPYQPKGNRKLTWTWRVAKRGDVFRLMLAMYPLLSERRKEQLSQCFEEMYEHNKKMNYVVQ